MRKALLLFLVVVLVACEDEKPKDILPKETMIKIIEDISLGEGKVSNMNIRRDSALSVFAAYEEAVFKKYEITREFYKKSLSYYFDNPSELENVYSTVLDSLVSKEQQMKELENRPEKMKKRYNSKEFEQDSL